MKKIERLHVKITYEVAVGRVEMPDEVYNQFIEAMDNGHDIDTDDHRYPDAADWINTEISEARSMGGDCEVISWVE